MPVDGLADFVTLCHKHGLKVKLYATTIHVSLRSGLHSSQDGSDIVVNRYFTTRELSNRCAEIFA